MSRLKDRIIRLIATQGPITVADYMQMALFDPVEGYYTTRDPFGRGGDFITAPEISQMFGELIGLFLIQAWEDRGQPDNIYLVELGPGRGTLMADILRTIKIRPALREATTIILVEASPALRALQKKNLEGAHVHWADSFAEVPQDQPLYLIANEFLDCMPVHQFVKGKTSWHERMVIEKDGALALALSPDAVPDTLIPATLRHARENALFETMPGAQGLIVDVAAAVTRTNGVALFIDYGHGEHGLGDTFQAVRDHKYAHPLEEPGEADLTAHVDFAALKKSAQEAGAKTYGPITQGQFLGALGLATRGETLKRSAPRQRDDIDAAIDRLSGETHMGSLFKVLALTAPGAPALPGF
jgi:SAM-dependent MidA family methyltransferase